MALYKNPDFCELPPALWKIFNASATESFFSLPQWYDLMVRFGVPTGTDVRVYTGKWPAYPAAILLQVDHNK